MSVSVVIPCLNEEDSIEACVSEVKEAFRSESALEVLVVDNGSTDRSRELAERAGAKVLQERRRGYGSAILRGLSEAQHEFIVMGDADLTYDFHDGKELVDLLRQTQADFAIGNRLNEKMEKGAMPVLHQKLGTPVLSGLMRLFFGTEPKDINCGLRAFRREKVPEMRLQATGMEFASEMVIHAKKAGMEFVEKPIRYRRRGGGEAKLRTFRDGWRHLRFILLCAPFPVFLLPALMFLGLSAFCFLNVRLGYQVLGGLLALLSAQLLFFALIAKAFLWVADDFLVDRRTGRALHRFRLEYGILSAVAFAALGLVLIWFFDLANLIRGATLLALSVQLFFSSFLLSMILSKARPTEP